MDFKKFLIFVVILIGALSIGMTAYYFLRDTEVIVLKDTLIYTNLGDEDFVIEIDRRDAKSSTTVGFEIADKSILKLNTDGTFSALKAGKTEVYLVTNKKRIDTQKCEVYVGDGSEANPFFIKDVATLKKVGTDIYKLDKFYKVCNNLDLSGEATWKPIADGVSAGFTGSFDGNEHTISNIVSISTTNDYAGFFAKVGNYGTVKNLTLDNVSVVGSFAYAGVVAGENNGNITCVRVKNAEVSSSKNSSYIGGIAGVNTTIGTRAARIDRVASQVEVGHYGKNCFVAGLTAENAGGIVINSYHYGQIKGTQSGAIAGLVANNVGQGTLGAYIKDCYSATEFELQSGVYGLVAINTNGLYVPNKLMGLYYDTTIAPQASLEPYGGTILGWTIYGKTTSELKDKKTYYSHDSVVAGATVKKYWNFDIIWTFNSVVGQAYPDLFMKGSVADDLDIETNPHDIYTPEQLLNINNDLNASYRLCANIDLSSYSDWQPIGSVENPFNGSLDGNGFVIYNLQITSHHENAGLFTCIGEQGSIKNVVINGVYINVTVSGTNTGVIAGINNGFIENCQTLQGTLNTACKKITILSLKSNAESCIGAVVGNNNLGTIKDSFSNLAIEVKSGNDSCACVGGVSGANNGYIYSTNSTSVISMSNNNERVGGLVGLNKRYITTSNFKGEIHSNMDSDRTYVGGIAGYNIENGVIEKCAVQMIAEGYNAGGVVAYNNYGRVSECAVLDGTTITGKKVGGLCSSLERGEFYDCYTLAMLQGKDGDSKKAGYSVYVLGSTDVLGKGECARIYHCFSACQFDNTGSNYRETVSNVRVSLLGSDNMKEAGFIYDTVYNEDLVNGGASCYSSGTFWGTGSNTGFNHGKWYNNMDGRHNTAECKSTGPFSELGFSLNVWNYGNDSYPTLKNVNYTLFN